MRTVQSTGGEWAQAPPVTRASAGAVDVWRADLRSTSGRYRELLSDDERLRVERFVRTAHGGWWSTARGILRALLARYLDAEPRALRFDTGPYGKPALREPAGTLRFNVSHAGGTALYAIADGREVGVDVEHEERRVDAVRVARRIFGVDEADRLSALDPAGRQREFLRLWVRHEAIVKCLGTGIGGYRNEPARDEAPRVTELDVGPGALAALAVMGSDDYELRCWEWPAEWPA